MTKVCDKHLKEPAFIYGQCIGCEVEMWQRENKRLQQELSESREHYFALEQNWLRYRKALEFYADNSNYYQPKPFATPWVEVDKGEKAREAIKGDETV